MNWLERHITLQDYDDRKAEIENAVTHFLGSALSVAGLILILTHLDRAKDSSLRFGLIIFALTNILLYTASGLYHILPRSNAKRICRILDHSSIYILIAGTYTPILMYIGTRECYMLLAFMYLIVASGITVTILFWEKLKVVHVILYLIMGWLCVFFSADIFPFIPSGIVKFLLLGGLSYTFGLVFYAVKKIPHYHGIWHVFVLLGSIFFYVGILFYLT